jgi:hypothetical protein
MKLRLLALVLIPILPAAAVADVGDPQAKTDHPWYPGELAFSTFDRLFTLEKELFQRSTGREPRTDEEKALAALLFRLTHYWHGEEGTQNYWGQGFTEGGDLWTRDYWTGLFAHGYGLCGTTHAQWSAEMSRLLGPGRGRAFGCVGHSSFEVLLKGGTYGDGKWVLLDHDISTVVYNKEGTALLSIPEIQENLKELTNPAFMPERQHGWPMASYFKEAGAAYGQYNSAGTHEGYAGAPPIVHLRRGETLRRYLKPGLEDGKTFVFWGMNYNTAGIPGPERWGSWVNQPDKLFTSKGGAGYHEGQARFANAVYRYTPDFANGDYKEGVVDESDQQVTFEFTTPYIIGCTPPNEKGWGIYDPGGKNGFILSGKASCPVSLSIDCGRTWVECGPATEGMDLTDRVKGYRQYLVRLGAGAKSLAGSGFTMTTVCQASVSVIPRLKDGGTRVAFQSSGRAVHSAGPTREQGRAHLVEGAFGTPMAVLELKAPRDSTPTGITAAAQVASYTEPNPRVKYQIDLSTDAGKSWSPLVKDWQIVRLGKGPKSGWSQSFVWGDRELSSGPVRVRFSNDGGIEILRAEAHLIYRTPGKDGTRMTFDWTDDAGDHRESHVFPQVQSPEWDLKTGKNAVTRWVEYAVERAR